MCKFPRVIVHRWRVNESSHTIYDFLLPVCQSARWMPMSRARSREWVFDVRIIFWYAHSIFISSRVLARSLARRASCLGERSSMHVKLDIDNCQSRRWTAALAWIRNACLHCCCFSPRPAMSFDILRVFCYIVLLLDVSNHYACLPICFRRLPRRLGRKSNVNGCWWQEY